MVKNKDVTDRQKARIVIQELRDKGHRICDIIRMGYSPSLVRRWFHRNSIKDKKGKGRKPKLDDVIRQRIDQEVIGKVGIGTRTVAKILEVQFKAEGREWAPKRSSILRY